MNFIDLGLPSGTLWAESNENAYFTFDEAVEKYGDSLPTREQLEELKDHCRWEWMGDGYKVTGVNGNSITLPAAGFRYSDGDVRCVGSLGFYWSSMPCCSVGAWILGFTSGGVGMYNYHRCFGRSVRLVKKTQKII